MSKETKEAHATSILFFFVTHLMIFLIFFLYENQLRRRILEVNLPYLIAMLLLVVLEVVLFFITGRVTRQEPGDCVGRGIGGGRGRGHSDE